MKKLKPNWHQVDVTHCPSIECKGMLLESSYHYAKKCSKCGKLWLEITEYVEVPSLE